MASDRQIQANRRNARLSTGPVTPAGKARSSLNNLRHGLYSRTPVLPGENLAHYHSLLRSLLAEFQPRTLAEQHFVHVIADSLWRLQRTARTEAGRLESTLRHAAKLRQPDPDIAADPDLLRNFYLGAAYQEDAIGANLLEKLARHEERLHRRIFRALHELRTLRRRRQNNGENANSNPIPSPPDTPARRT